MRILINEFTMRFMYVPQIIPLLASFSFCLGLSIYALRYRKVPGAIEFIWATSVGTLWAVFNALELASADIPTKLVWNNLQYSIYGFGPLIWLSTVWRFSERKPMSGRFLALLGVVPCLTTVFVWLDPLLGLVRSSWDLDTAEIPYVLTRTVGPWYLFHYLYSQGLNVACLVILVHSITKKGSLYRYQSIYILAALAVVYVSEIPYALRLGPYKRYDLTPTLFCMAALIFWIGIFRHRLLEIVPIARTTVLERMANSIIVVDAAGRIIDINASARDRFNLLWPPVTGQKLRSAIPALSSVLSTFVVKDGERNDSSVRREFEMDLDGQHRLFEFYASPILDSTDSFAAWGLIVTDISDLKRAQVRLINQEAELSAASERERLSRELHDNLGQVLSFAVLQSDSIMTEIRRKNFTLAEPHVEQLNRTLKEAHKDLRDFVYDLRDQEDAEISLKDLVAHQAALVETCCRTKVSNGLAGIEELVNLDARQKKEILFIVKEALNNVAKHAKAGTVKIDKEIRHDTLMISIVDDGVGLCGRSEGAGSGLHIMRERAKALGGHLSIESSPRTGTKISIHLPLPEGNILPGPIALETAAAAGDSRVSRSVLLVDDHALFLDGLSRVLMARGFTIAGKARNGREAIEMAKALKPDLVLMDIQMPECDGLTATRLLSAERPEQKIVMLTMSEYADDLHEAIRSGASGYLLKGLGADELIAELSSILEGGVRLSSSIATKIMEEFGSGGQPGEQSSSESLTDRQTEVLALLVQGWLYKEIGMKLGISERTVKYHMSQIIEKLHLKNRSEVEAFATKRTRNLPG